MRRFLSVLMFSTMLIATMAMAEDAKEPHPPAKKPDTSPEAMEALKKTVPSMAYMNNLANAVTQPAAKKKGDEPTPPPVTAALSDGGVVQFRHDGSVAIVRPNGMVVRPPDGTMTLRDGTTFTVENGMRVDH